MLGFGTSRKVKNPRMLKESKEYRRGSTKVDNDGSLGTGQDPGRIEISRSAVLSSLTVLLVVSSKSGNNPGLEAPGRLESID